MDRVLQMLLKRLFSQMVSKGMKAGITHVANKGKSPADMTPEERAQAQMARKAGQRARQAANIARKFLR